jgi:hypothetical protein
MGATSARLSSTLVRKHGLDHGTAGGSKKQYAVGGLHAGVEVDLGVREGHRHELEHLLHDAAEVSATSA